MKIITTLIALFALVSAAGCQKTIKEARQPAPPTDVQAS
jgi:hypothetical protein